MIPAGLKREVEARLSTTIGTELRIDNAEPVGGGCINQVARLDTSAGPFFIKHNSQSPSAMFEREAEGLAELRSVGGIAAPEPICWSDRGVGFPAFLVTSYIQTGRRRSDFSERFGAAFAELHRRGRGERFGFHHDNYIGTTPQPNGWCDNWVEFWREHRLGHQMRLARGNGYTGELQRLGDKLLTRLDDYLVEPDEAPALLHGDLWGGNYLVGDNGDAVLIDPACYHGRREADLAMTMLFGGFDARFHAAYNEAWPLSDGSNERMEIYKLYHLLNHLNLFGGSYFAQCVEAMRRFQ